MDKKEALSVLEQLAAQSKLTPAEFAQAGAVAVEFASQHHEEAFDFFNSWTGETSEEEFTDILNSLAFLDGLIERRSMDFDHSDLLEEENFLLLEPKDTKKPRKVKLTKKVADPLTVAYAERLEEWKEKILEAISLGEMELRELCKLTNLSMIEAWMGALLYPDLFVIEREGDGFYSSSVVVKRKM